MFKSFFKKKINKEVKKNSTLDENLFTIACVLVEAALVDNNFGNEEKNNKRRLRENEMTETINRYMLHCYSRLFDNR